MAAPMRIFSRIFSRNFLPISLSKTTFPSNGLACQFSSVPPEPTPIPYSEFDKAQIDFESRENIDVEEIDDSEAFKWVDKLIPKPLVPEPPVHESYPTPSGWIPQTVKPGDLPYFVRRSRFHNMPVYLCYRKNNTVKFTRVRHVEGDIWAFEVELREYLNSVRKKGDKPIVTKVHEVGQFVNVNGIQVENIVTFLLQKGL